MIITKEFLFKNPHAVFVFGDNLLRKGRGGAAVLRNYNTHGFITKKLPSNEDEAFFSPREYSPVYETEIEKLQKVIEENPNNIFLISPVGSGLANRYKIFEEVIVPNIKYDLKRYKNILWLW